MIISRTPYRISFFGGGTDYPAWYTRHGGAVLAATIDKYCYLTCRYLPPFFEHRFRVVYSLDECCKTVDEITHPPVRAALKHMGFQRGVEIHHVGDLPARSGMGSSSAFTVGLLHGLHALRGEMPGKERLAQESIFIEQEVLRETVGSQDQVQAAYGGLNHVTFQPNGEISVRPVTVAPSRVAELNAHLMLFYTGIKRTSGNIAQSYVQNMDSRKRQLRILKDLVDEGISVLGNGIDIRHFGELLHESWQVKRSLADLVTNPEVDGVYTRALAAGAVGGKLTGAGGGGFLLLFVPPDRQPQVKAELDDLLHVPFHFEFGGSQIIFYDPEKDYSAEDVARQSQPAVVFRELELREEEKLVA